MHRYSELRPCARFPGYLISRSGIVVSCKGRKKRLLQQYIPQCGYVEVQLRRNGERVHALVHTLVLETWQGPRPPGHECRHLDGNPLNLDASNLAWGTKKQNAADKLRHGTMAIGERNGQARLREADVVQIRQRLASGDGCVQIARDYGRHHSTIASIRDGETWRCLPMREDDGGER